MFKLNYGEQGTFQASRGENNAPETSDEEIQARLDYADRGKSGDGRFSYPKLQVISSPDIIFNPRLTCAPVSSQRLIGLRGRSVVVSEV
jgi:hypothetical protein